MNPNHKRVLPNVLQTNAKSESNRKLPVAPPVYRLQPLRVLQTKMANQQSGTSYRLLVARRPVAPPVYRPQPTPVVLQRKVIPGPSPAPSRGSTRRHQTLQPKMNAAHPQPPSMSGVRAHRSPYGLPIQMAEGNALPPKWGQEGGVNWVWVKNLELEYVLDEFSHKIPPHPIHKKNVAGLGGNDFYGSFTIVYSDGSYQHYDQYIHRHPTKEQHTEPQYMEWFKNELLKLLYHGLKNVGAVVLEIAQTNTPCSKESCRKAIMDWVSTKSLPNGYFLARMSAYQIYEHQPPKVYITTMEIKKFDKQDTQPVEMEKGLVVHRIPEKY